MCVAAGSIAAPMAVRSGWAIVFRNRLMNKQQDFQEEETIRQVIPIRRRTFLRSALGALALLPGRSRALSVFSHGKPVRFKQDRFCISFWVDPPAGAHMEEHYAQLAAANFTVAMGGFGANTPKTDRRQLDLCQKYGLKALVYLPGYEDGAIRGPAAIDEIKLADKFPNHPACWGYMLHDEPGARLFPNLRYMVNHLRTARPDKLGFINLLPAYASAIQLVLQRYKWLQSQTIMSFNFSPSMCNR